MQRRRVLFWSGLGIAVTGLIIAAQIPFFYFRSHMEGGHLLNQAKGMLPSGSALVSVNQGQPTSANQTHFGSTLMLSHVQPDTLVGGIQIPPLGVEAPMLQGTDDAELNVGAGHLVTSAWPGENGTCVVAAHNATWFRHIDKLRSGDTIQLWTRQGFYTYKVTNSRIVQTGAPIQNTSSPSLVLEACYPLDALYLTPSRFLVYAQLMKAEGAKPGPSTPSATPNQIADILYHGEVPEDLLHQGVTLSTNALPMGALRFTGFPSVQYTQSNAPLSAASTLVQMYLAWVHASAERNYWDLQSLLPLGAPPDDTSRLGPSARMEKYRTTNPLLGAQLEAITYNDRFDVTLHVIGQRLESATGTTSCEVSGHRYRVDVDAMIDDHNVMRLSKLSVVPQW